MVVYGLMYIFFLFVFNIENNVVYEYYANRNLISCSIELVYNIIIICLLWLFEMLIVINDDK